MEIHSSKDRMILEFMLIGLVLGMTMVFHLMNVHGLLALNLFFLPILLAGYYLGRRSAGVLALLSVLAVSIAAGWFLPRFGAYERPVMVALALTIWASALGLTAILVGTLCDERARTVNELHRAYVGVVEVLFKYLQSSDPHTKARSIRISELSQAVANDLRLPRKQIDDIRVAALLRDLESVEITTQLVTRAMDTLERQADSNTKHTFQGADLVHSLGSVLESALPLIAGQDDDLRDYLAAQGHTQDDSSIVGARIISTVRAFDALSTNCPTEQTDPVHYALRELLREESGHDAETVEALARVVRTSGYAHHQPNIPERELLNA